MEIRQRHVGSVICLDLQGRLISGDEDSVLKDKVNSLLFQGHRTILLNLEGVSHIDTLGLSALIAIRHAADRSGCSVKLLNLPSPFPTLLLVTMPITAS